jgi:outer membrane protein assembly factor BamD
MKRALLAFGLLAAGCASRDKELDLAAFSGRSDRLVWEAGQTALKKKDWLTAREHFRRIVDGFPNSEYAAQARVALGDTYYREGGTANYILAISEYRQFLTLFPSHAQSDYAQFQVAECFFKQKNGPDRDQTNTEKALLEYLRLQEVYPTSSHAEAGRARIIECRQTLARAEYLAGFFYQRTRQAYRAAIGRYEFIVKEYPDYDKIDEVLYRLGEAMCASGRGMEAKPHLGHLVESYPQSPFADSARRLLGTGCPTEASPPSPAPAATASPSPIPPASPSPAPSSPQ